MAFPWHIIEAPIWLAQWWACLVCRSPVEASFLPGIFSPLTSAEACEKSSRWLWKEKLSTGVRKPGNMCITDCHDMTLAVKVALNANTINQSNIIETDLQYLWNESSHSNYYHLLILWKKNCLRIWFSLFGVLCQIIGISVTLFNGDSSQILVSWTIFNQYLISPSSWQWWACCSANLIVLSDEEKSYYFQLYWLWSVSTGIKPKTSRSRTEGSNQLATATVNSLPHNPNF